MVEIFLVYEMFFVFNSNKFKDVKFSICKICVYLLIWSCSVHKWWKDILGVLFGYFFKEWSENIYVSRMNFIEYRHHNFGFVSSMQKVGDFFVGHDFGFRLHLFGWKTKCMYTCHYVVQHHPKFN